MPCKPSVRSATVRSPVSVVAPLAASAVSLRTAPPEKVISVPANKAIEVALTVTSTPAPWATVPETVTGATTGTTANLVEWDAQEGWIKLKTPTGTFAIGELIVGSESGAQIVLDSRNEQATADPKYSESVTFESLGDDIMDFSEGNPFGLAGNL